MRKLYAEVICCVVCVAGVACGAEPARDPVVVKQRYDEIVSQLDEGGDLFVVANVEGALENVVETMVAGTAAMMTNAASVAPVRETLVKLREFLASNGFYAVRGLGMSVVPRKDGLNTVKSFLSLAPEAMEKPLWRGVVGGQPRRPDALRFLPSDAAFVRVGRGDPGALWQLVQAGIEQVATAKTAQAFRGGILVASSQIGMPLDALIESLGDEGFVSIQLSRDTNVTIPTGAGSVRIPEPSLLIGVAIDANTLPDLIHAKLAQTGIPATEVLVNDVTIRSMNLPLPLPVPVQPSYAVCSGYFLFGTTMQAVKAAVKACQSGGGLAASPEFRKAFEGLPMVNNGLVYLSPRFSEVVMQLQTQAFDAASATSSGNQVNMEALRKLLGNQGAQSSALVIVNTGAGILAKGSTTAGGRQVMVSTAMVPVGMLAAVAIPSFTKARETSQKNACRNNLRQIRAAKQQWAVERAKGEGAVPTPADLAPYLRNAWPMLTCPKGGSYRINAVGAQPQCTVPGHGL